MKIFILGINGFIGVNLLDTILKKTDWHVVGFDINNDNITPYLDTPRFEYIQGDIFTNRDCIRTHIQACDVVIPLIAIANPLLYVERPLDVFKLDFEENLKIVYDCIAFKKRLIFPSTSEVYGMCEDAEFNEDTSNLITGPIHKERWIYSTSKQMLDRVIYAAGKHEGLQFTLFRPFNFMGPYQDNPFACGKQNRAIPTFISRILYGQNITLVNGGMQKRCFVYIKDATDCLVKIIQNKDGFADGEIFNIGATNNEYTIQDIANMVLDCAEKIPDYTDVKTRVSLVLEDESTYYGTGYQDVNRRVPCIQKARDILGWHPTTPIADAVQDTVQFYLEHRAKAIGHTPYND